MPPIGLVTDFGTKDQYVGAMKGAILSVNPDAQIADITHEIPKQNIRSGAFVLASAAETFPQGSIFVSVIDPGVGTKRKCILVGTENGLNFVGPDNGVLTLVVEKYGVEEIRSVENSDLMRNDTSSTFHGRDIMAPVGAHLSIGIETSEVGPRIEKIEEIEIEEAEVLGTEIRGSILNIDDFGNVVTNITKEKINKIAEIGDQLKVRTEGKVLKLPFLEKFADVPPGENLAYIGSSNLVEFAKNRGTFADETGMSCKDGIDIRITRNE